MTVTVKPDEGYELDKLTVSDRDGKMLKLTEKGENKFTFTMPGSSVTVKAAFRQAGTVPEPPPLRMSPPAPTMLTL